MEGTLRSDVFDLPLVNTPGCLGIFNGQVKMEKPKGLGAWPVIIPGDNVEIYYENVCITGPTVIEDVRHLEIHTPSLPAESAFEIVVSPDKMEATLIVTFRPGEEYELEDAKYTRKLTVKAKVLREVPPKPINPVFVIEELRKQGIVEQVDYQAIKQACTELKSGEFVIARGVFPTEPVDGRVELVCDLISRPIFPDDEGRVDFRERVRIAAVEPGDVLARWHPPKFGTPGRNVYGEDIIPRRPKDGMIRPGRGVKLVENGRLAVATISGRPVYRHGVLSVNQQIVIQNDVSMTTGNIRFTGDVMILGDVTEAMSVESGEIVDIKGNVYHAEVRAGSHIWVGKKVVGSRLMAGILQSGFNDAVVTLGRLGRALDKAAASLDKLRIQDRNQTTFVRNREGYLIKSLLEQRFTNVPSWFSELSEFLKGLYSDQDLLHDNDDLRVQIDKVLFWGQYLVGAGPLKLTSGIQLERAAASFFELKDRFEALVDSSAQISVGYCQNAHLEASGDITIRGPLTYNSEVSSGANLTIRGECRSGNYYGRSSITADTVGTGSMGTTKLSVSEEGTIRAAVLNPGVVVKVGPIPYEVTTKMYKTEFCLRDGAIVTRNFR